MRTGAKLLAAVVLGTIMSAGGCATLEDLDKARAQNAKMSEQLGQMSASLEKARYREAELLQQIAQRDATIAARDEEIRLLKLARTDLEKTRDELQALVNKLRGDVVGNPPIISALPSGLNQKLVELANKYGWKYDPQRGMVQFDTDLTFDPGSAQVKEGKAREALAKLAEIMNSEDGKPFNLYVVGHTDDIPILVGETSKKHPTNWYLSIHRAAMVEAILEKEKVAPDRLGVAGFSEYQPVVQNAPNKKGAGANRRVEIYIVPPDRMLGTRAAPSAT